MLCKLDYFYNNIYSILLLTKNNHIATENLYINCYVSHIINLFSTYIVVMVSLRSSFSARSKHIETNSVFIRILLILGKKPYTKLSSNTIINEYFLSLKLLYIHS